MRAAESSTLKLAASSMLPANGFICTDEDVNPEPSENLALAAAGTSVLVVASCVPFAYSRMVVVSRVITTWYQVLAELKLKPESNIPTVPTIPIRCEPDESELPLVAPTANP